MEENKKKMIMTMIISFVIAVAILAIGITYAVFSASSTTNTQTVITGDLSIKYDQGNILRTTNLYPIEESDVSTKATEFNFTVQNTGNIKGYFNISLTDIIIANELKNSNFRWQLLEGERVIKEGNFTNVGSTIKLDGGIEIEANNTKTYKIQIWINETGSPQNEMQGKNMSAKITVVSQDRITKTAVLTKKQYETTTPKFLLSWSDVSKIETEIRTINTTQNILFCTLSGEYFGINQKRYIFNALTGTTNLLLENLVDGEFHKLVINIDNAGTTDYIALVWDGTWSKEVSYKYIKIYDKSNNLIYDLIPDKSGKFYDLISNNLLDMYNGPTGDITSDTYTYSEE